MIAAVLSWFGARRFFLLVLVVAGVAMVLFLQDFENNRLKRQLDDARVQAGTYRTLVRSHEGMIADLRRQMAEDRAALVALQRKRAVIKREYGIITKGVANGQTPAIDGLVAVRDGVRQRLQAGGDLSGGAVPPAAGPQ